MASTGSSTAADDIYKLSLLIRSFQVRGHRLADLDPLGLTETPYVKDLDPAWYGFTEQDMKKEFNFASNFLVTGYLSGAAGKRTLGDIVRRLRETYAGRIGVEYMHIQEAEECDWIRSHIETPDPLHVTPAKRKVTLDRLMWADGFEKFLAQKWATAKRFGLEGGESVIPGLKAMIDKAADLGVTNVIMGMPHRGRLVTLATVFRKPLESIFAEFSGAKDRDSVESDPIGSGDVKYHLGTTSTRPTRSGSQVYLSLLANPSHLEAVNPLVLGKARAKQDELKDEHGEQVLPILFHGDASFAGQGPVYETMNFWELEGYKVGGTVHVVVNNQIGFTTDPKDARSSPYCTSVAKAVGAPIFHVNGDHPDEVVACFELAAQYRQRFHKDVVIDVVCYRRYGHNETDEPKFTQPQLYNVITKHPTTLQLYSKRLLEEGVITKDELDAMHEDMQKHMNTALDLSQSYSTKDSEWLESRWAGFKGSAQLARIRDTGVDPEVLKRVGEHITQVPEGFTAHKNLLKLFDARREMLKGNKSLDWATAELLAYGTLLLEGNRVRLSGQDVRRGTFSHRHAFLTDQKTGEKHNLLGSLTDTPFYCYNSALSEFGVLGFELGYSGESPNQLVLWEAQFGDFANSAQVIIDQFIASGEAKWLRQNGLVMLLPHGYDGMGPEHSSARIERFLQLVDSDPLDMPEDLGEESSKQIQETNMQVVIPSTPANMFHLLRRQVHREFRKPLICISPKNLLRHPLCVSPLSAFDNVEDPSETQPSSTDVRFRRAIGEVDPSIYNSPASVSRVLFCSGKIYYELLEERTKRGLKDVAIVRVEQMAPFPFDLIKSNFAHYPNAEPFWVQEEPANAGCYGFAALHFKSAIGAIPTYIGRPAAAATATGSAKRHVAEQRQVVTEAFEKPFRK